ncbi:hypothetical protein M8J75_006020 [Diaphorina citri]|nr:hypothetical protein M8J75_006020 [Diaphorina citri]
MDCVETTKKMVVSPRARRRVLEVKLKEKNLELRELCVREAELIGVLPPETPIEPGESPPSFTPKNTLFMKAMGAMPTESLKQSAAKDEDSLATLEQEYQTQSGIAEAAFGLANDVSISKSLRRKHRQRYQDSQHRIAELETRINLLKRTSNLDLRKHKNILGYHQAHDLRDDRIGVPIHGMDEVDQPLSLAPDNTSMLHYQRNFAPPVPKHQIQWGGHYNHPDSIHPIIQSSHGNHSSHSHKMVPHKHINYLPTMYSPSHEIQVMKSAYSKVSPNVSNSNISQTNNMPPNLINMNMNPTYHQPHHAPPHNLYDFQPHGDLKRFGSLDRRRGNYNPVPPPRPPHKQEVEENLMPKSHKPQLEPDTVLLPNQMYPENNIMRTQSLINVRESQQPLPPRLPVPWYELSDPPPPPAPSPPLASTPLVSSISNLNMDNIPYPIPTSNHNDMSYPVSTMSNHNVDMPYPVSTISNHNVVDSMSAYPVSTMSNNLNVVDNMTYQSQPPPPPSQQSPVVPYESPKNQTVVQVGKFQPYREISKPFEMSDFYKYSTKFRRKPGDPGTNTNPKANNNNHININKTKDNLTEQNSMTPYNQNTSEQPLRPDSTDMTWRQSEKSAGSHASTFV